jgi:hypothetical protein
MNVVDFTQRIPGADTLARAAGLRPRPTYSMLPGLSGIGWFTMGMLVGGAMALLMAPREGAQLRRDISRRFDDLAHRLNGSGRRHASGSRPEQEPGAEM